VRYVLVAALNRARRLGRRLAAVFALLSCSCRAQAVGLGHRLVGRVGPGSPPRPAMRRMLRVRARPIMGACSSSDWTVPSV
jgi:hypothetical protein